MKKALAIRHIPFEDLGTFEPVLRHNYTIKYIDIAFQPIPEDYHDLVIVLGGPIGVYEEDRYPFLTKEIEYLTKRLSENLPTLGICLGSQLIARALGSKVYSSGIKEIGWIPLQLTDEGKKSFIEPFQKGSMFHWHGDTFDLPKGAVLLASTPKCRNQIYSIGRTLAFQCHPEVSQIKLEQWWVGHANELAEQKINPIDLRKDTAKYAPQLESAAPGVLKEWIDSL